MEWLSRSLELRVLSVFCCLCRLWEGLLGHMSTLFFKFKSSKDFDSLDCDGQMSAFDVKHAITTKHKLDKDPNFDLQLVNAQVSE
jgi:hypothetical protein